MKILLYLLIFFCTALTSFAVETYFDFRLNSVLVPVDKDLTVKFDYLLEGVRTEDFTVIPVSENTLIEIYNTTSKKWVGQNSLRTEFPDLEPQMQIKLKSINGTKVKICFNFQHIKTGVLYNSPCRTYWNRDYFQKYLKYLLCRNLSSSSNYKNC